MTTDKIKSYTAPIAKSFQSSLGLLLEERKEVALKMEQVVNTNEIRILIGQIKIINVKIKHLLGI